MDIDSHAGPPPPPATSAPSNFEKLLKVLKRFTILAISIGVMIAVPILGLWSLLPLKARFPDFFGFIWSSKYDLCGRLWIVASLLSTLIVTNTVITGFLSDNRFDSVRKAPAFKRSSIAIQTTSVFSFIVGLVVLIFPATWHAIWLLKFMALFLALTIWIADYFILRVVRVHEHELEDEFEKTVKTIDCPATLSILFTIILSFTYLRWVMPPELNAPLEGEIFVMGLSSGAVAVELWFANFFFWYLLGEQ